MSAGEWTFYDLTTGRIRGTFAGPAEALELNTPDGCGVINGLHEAGVSRVDLDLEAVVPDVPPRPSAQHEWDEGGHRWLPPLAARRAAAADRAARQAIDAAELASLRAMREALLELLPAESPARRVLAQADAAIASERTNLKKG